MKSKRSLMILMAGSMLMAMLPGAVAAHGDRGDRGDLGHRRHAPELKDGYIPGCWRGFRLWYDPQPVDGVRNPGIRRADRNGDGWGCYKIRYSRRDRSKVVAYRWTDNRNLWKQEEL